MIEKLSPKTLRRHKGVSFVGVTTPFLCYDEQGRVFLAKRSKKSRDEQGRWDFGSGGLKVGETIEENMRRELMEEYGVEPIKITFIGHFELFRTLPNGTKTHWIGVAHAVQVDPKKVRIMEPEMFEASGWFTLDTLPSPLHSAIQPVYLERYRDKIREIIGAKADIPPSSQHSRIVRAARRATS